MPHVLQHQYQWCTAEVFNKEKELYVDKSKPLGAFLPQLRFIAEGEGSGEVSGLRDARGNLMPPCTIMEKGKALDAWLRHSGKDFCLGLQVKYAVSIGHFL